MVSRLESAQKGGSTVSAVEILVQTRPAVGSRSLSSDETALARVQQAPAHGRAGAGASRELQGLALNAVATVFGTGMSLFAKITDGQGIGVFEIVLTRSIILLLFTAPPLAYHRCNPFHDPKRRWLLVLRGVLGFLAVSLLYLTVSLLPLATASTLSFVSPIFVAALSPFILGEHTERSVATGIPVAMLGVLLVAQPWGSDGVRTLGVAVGLFQALFNSLSRITVRALSVGSSEPISAIIFGQGLVSCIGAVLVCVVTGRFQVPSTPRMWGPLLAGGLLGYAYQLALTGGLQRARAAPAVAMSYLSIMWGLLADVFVFHHLPNALSCVGAAVICVSSLLVALGHRRQTAAHAAACAVASEPQYDAEASDVDAERRPLLAEGAGNPEGQQALTPGRRVLAVESMARGS